MSILRINFKRAAIEKAIMVKYQKQTILKKIFFVHSIKMLNLSTKELKAIARIRGIKGYKSMSEDELLGALNSSK